MAEIMVRQWSFCPKCRGRGCRECQGKGTVVALIPLKMLPADSGSSGTRGSYAAAQKDFIKEQERQRTSLPFERQLERKDRWQDPEYRAKLSAATKKQWQDPEYRAKVSAAMKKQWQDPEYRAKVSAATKKQWQDPEFRARMSAASKKRWQDPEFRAKVNAARKKRWQIRMKAGGTGERPGINI